MFSKSRGVEIQYEILRQKKIKTAFYFTKEKYFQLLNLTRANYSHNLTCTYYKEYHNGRAQNPEYSKITGPLCQPILSFTALR